MDDLLTEQEVAKILRCSKAKIRRLRANGDLAFLAGRPALIERAALAAYIATIRRETRLADKPAEKELSQERLAEIERGAREAFSKMKERRRRRKEKKPWKSSSS